MEEMTLEQAIAEVRGVAAALEIDLPSDAGYVERLNAVADFLEQFGMVLKEGMNGIVDAVNQKNRGV